MSKGVSNVFGIIAWVISGFFFYCVNLLAFLNQPIWPIKTTIIVVFAVPAVVFLIIAVLCRGIDRFRRDLGIVLLATTGNNLLVIVSFICMLASPDIAKSLPPDFTKMFSAVFSGVACLTLYALIGGGLIFASRKAGVAP